MILLAILISLALERYTAVGPMLQRFTWFNIYLEKLHQTVGQSPIWNNYGAVAVVIVPVLVVVAIVYYAFMGVSFGLLSFIIATFVLYYCLSGTKQSDDTEQLFYLANEQLFAVLFWFAVLGPVGAVLYRLTVLLKHKAQELQGPFAQLQEPATTVQALLDWIPVRLMAVGYALVGHFTDTFDYWLEHVLSAWQKNQEFLLACGSLAAGKNSDVSSVSALIDRALVLFIVVVALFTLGSWLYFI